MKSALVVDDSAFMRKVLRGMLEKHGYVVVGEAPDGRQALSEYQRLRPTFVTMDINMPDVTGTEAVRDILSFDTDAVIVMVTSIGTKDKVMEVLEAGARSYILKPFTEENLVGVLSQVLTEQNSGG